MKTFYLAHPACHLHDPNPGHPECPDRLVAIDDAVAKAGLPFLHFPTPAMARTEDLLLAHNQNHVDHVFASMPTGRSLNFLDSDTVLCADSKDAALYAVGAVLQAVDIVMVEKHSNAFCAVRPPGHHAHRDHAAGFCLFNNIAIGALYALKKYKLNRVAILDFDVHHGDGTEDIVKNNPAVFFASTYQYPLYASDENTALETGISYNVMNRPYTPGTSRQDLVKEWTENILPQVERFRPEMIFVSAGFDGHRQDPLANLSFEDEDYGAIMSAIRQTADKICQGRLVATLEGGYHLQALPRSVIACLKAMNGS